MRRSPKRPSQADKRCFRDHRHSRGAIPRPLSLPFPASGEEGEALVPLARRGVWRWPWLSR